MKFISHSSTFSLKKEHVQLLLLTLKTEAANMKSCYYTVLFYSELSQYCLASDEAFVCYPKIFQ